MESERSCDLVIATKQWGLEEDAGLLPPNLIQFLPCTTQGPTDTCVLSGTDHTRAPLWRVHKGK
jgi:hypothetical protein